MTLEGPPVAHLTRDLLDDFFVGTRGVGELAATAVGHLGEVCAACRSALAGVEELDVGLAFRPEAGGRAVVDRLRRDHHALPHLLAELLPLGSAQTEVRVATDRRYATVAFVDHEMAVAWAALEQGGAAVAGQAAELASLALRRLAPGHYGAPLLGRLEREVRLLWARLSLRQGRADVARGHLLSAARVAHGRRSTDLRLLEALAAAELRLAAGRWRCSRALLGWAGRSEAGAVPCRWRLPVERLAARLDRFAGDPAAAARRLLPLVPPATLAGALEWSIARELVFALAEAGEASKAAAWLAAWRLPARAAPGGPGGERERGTSRERAGTGRPEDRPDLELLLGGLLRRQGRPDEALPLLRGARDAFLRRGRGAVAVHATVELLRLHRAQGDAQSLRLETADLDRLAEHESIPRPVLRELTRFAAAVWRGKVEADLEPVERSLLYTDAASS